MTTKIRDPELQPVWNATPTNNRYQIGGVPHILIERGGVKRVVALEDLTPREIRKIILDHAASS